MSKYELMGLYLLGWIPMLFAGILIGMKICNRMWRKIVPGKVIAAYSRGWDHGYGYLQKIEDARTDQMSGVTVKAGDNVSQ